MPSADEELRALRREASAGIDGAAAALSEAERYHGVRRRLFGFQEDAIVAMSSPPYESMRHWAHPNAGFDMAWLRDRLGRVVRQGVCLACDAGIPARPPARDALRTGAGETDVLLARAYLPRYSPRFFRP